MGRGGPSLGTAPLTSGRRRKGKQGGSEKGRTQKKKFPGYAKMRRRAVLSSFYFKQLDQLPRIPEMPKQGASSGAPHPARVIAAELTRPGETPPTTRWVYDLLCKIHRIGHEHYDPDTDGRSGERPGAQKLTAEDDPLLFEMRKKGSREERAVQISESLNNQGRDGISATALKNRQDRLEVETKRTQVTTMQSDDEEKRWKSGGNIAVVEFDDRVRAFEEGKATTADGLPAIDVRGGMFADEHSHRCSMGPHGKTQVSCPADFLCSICSDFG
jgi:hypothetical protein